MMTETYGDKPLVFAFDGDGEQYMIGSEVNIFRKSDVIYLSILEKLFYNRNSNMTDQVDKYILQKYEII